MASNEDFDITRRQFLAASAAGAVSMGLTSWAGVTVAPESGARNPKQTGIAREPDAKLYQQQWNVKLPPTRHESFDNPGRPRAHWEYQRARIALVGNFPDGDHRWRQFKFKRL